MNDFDSKDFFTDESFIPDPHPYFDHLRSQCPVQHVQPRGVVAVTGHAESMEVLRRATTYSSITAPIGPFAELPFTPEGDDITDQVNEHRTEFPLHEWLVTMDPPQHTETRRLLAGLFTPQRFRENEEFIQKLAVDTLAPILDSGRCEVLSAYAKPFALLTIADLLGVPEEDHGIFHAKLGKQIPGAMDEDKAYTSNPLEFLEETFGGYIEDRRRNPRGDILTALAQTTYPDGRMPEVIELVRLAAFLFGAGLDTTATVIGAGLRIIAEDPQLQKQLRDDRDLIPNFIEELLRMEGPVKSDFRLALVSTRLGGVDIPAGTTLNVHPSAANRDPLVFENPHDFRLDRPNAKDHIAFGRGIHACPGGPLARVEARVSINYWLDRTTDITISEAVHGPSDARRFTYEPSYTMRALTELHLEFTPAP
ncbi:cytochrome P450 [Rhodococcus sp. NPDC058639]|uniref:cytochrome P450 n=1 Tax=Rhodococcus sp. NPDC058639 TaxID=3346570 RepID=UPI0036688911